MSDQTPNSKGNRSKSFNNWASGLAALFGILAACVSAWGAYQTRDLQQKVAELDEDFKVATIVSGLVNSLSDPDLERDLALIALRDSLVSDFDNQREQNIYLVFNVAVAVADNAISQLLEKYGQSEIEIPKDESEKLENDLRIARSIIDRFSSLEHPKKEKMLREQQRIADKVASIKGKLAEAESADASVVDNLDVDQDWLVVFSADPALSIDQPISAEFEVKIAKDKLGKEAIVLQKHNLFSTALVFDTKQHAQDNLSTIQDQLNRSSAFITSLEGFCSNYSTFEETAIRDNDRYQYKLYKCERTLQIGSQGSDVAEIKKQLIALGYLENSQDDINVYFDEDMQEAVRRFQTAERLTADGIIGSSTRLAIRRAYQDLPKNK